MPEVKAAIKNEEVNLVVLNNEPRIISIVGVMLFPGITVVPAAKSKTLQESEHFKAQIRNKHLVIIECEQEGEKAQNAQPISGDHDMDQVNAIMATPEKAAVKAVKGQLNIPVLKKVVKVDPRANVKVAAQVKIDELTKVENE